MADRQARLLRLAGRLSHAATMRDWAELAEADAELRAHAAEFAAREHWSTAELRAFAVLEHAHLQARERCACEAERTEARMAELRSRRSGWMAYALNGDPDESNP
ncbi:hypothetical protein OOT46_01470 [Aquabacterium sp. A7-Y]|uniref:hypothetical protein n=1 Tax=Aquabacterium sp. A7-Y TaxID=1349605 RepID=UPI00223D1410|nr:hypothetical protein [Aquabacterium sp. A7-Y]MCW7536525.1 hypothetical protein [Aquabacterium sp. A7-Y]